MAPTEARSLAIQDFQRHFNIYQDASEGQDDEVNAARVALIDKARGLIAALETPLESILWMAWAEPTRMAASRLAIKLGLFEQISRDGDQPKTRDELASSVGADPNLIGRLLKHLAAMRMIEETGSDTYRSTQVSRALTVPIYRDAIPASQETAGMVFQRMPEYFVKANWAEPQDGTAGPFQYAHGTAQHIFDWRAQRPYIQETFNNHMAGYHAGRPSWTDAGFYPIEDRILPDIKRDADAVTIVDIGGGLGHDLAELKEKRPNIPGRFVLQDLWSVIQQVPKQLNGIEPTVHDFFSEQPIKGARIYFMHSVLHDWPDAECKQILQRIKPVMEKGYSKLLIHENVVPDVNASWHITSLDMFMMALFATRERTESQWRELLGSAGFRIVGIWNKNPAFESLIEAVLDD